MRYAILAGSDTINVDSNRAPMHRTAAREADSRTLTRPAEVLAVVLDRVAWWIAKVGRWLCITGTTANFKAFESGYDGTAGWFLLVRNCRQLCKKKWRADCSSASFWFNKTLLYMDYPSDGFSVSQLIQDRRDGVVSTPKQAAIIRELSVAFSPERTSQPSETPENSHRKTLTSDSASESSDQWVSSKRGQQHARRHHLQDRQQTN